MRKVRKIPETSNGNELRTAQTKARLLAAAEEVFVREGFEKAQLNTIAQAAGRTKGSIYAHYKSKDDLFMELYRHRTRQEISRLLKRLSFCNTRKKTQEQLKLHLIGYIKDPSWPLLTLQFKIYALTRPEARERWIQDATLRNFTEFDEVLLKLTSGFTPAQRRAFDVNLTALGPILASMLLESTLEPKLLTKKRLAALLDALFTLLLRVPAR